MPQYSRPATIPNPPRFVGNLQTDSNVAIQYIESLYRSLVLESGVFQQPSGFVQVSGSAAVFVVTFDDKQANANYAVSITPISKVGAPAAASAVVDTVAKTDTGFVVTLQAAPGTNTSRIFDWSIQR